MNHESQTDLIEEPTEVTSVVEELTEEESMSSESSSSPKKTTTPEVSRRDFLRVGGLSVVGLSVAEKAARAQMLRSVQHRSCIFIMMNGGVSQLDTFDPKPDAPVELRGALKSIQTAIAGVRVNESLPRIAERANQIAFLRSLHHTAARFMKQVYNCCKQEGSQIVIFSILALVR